MTTSQLRWNFQLLDAGEGSGSRTAVHTTHVSTRGLDGTVTCTRNFRCALTHGLYRRGPASHTPPKGWSCVSPSDSSPGRKFLPHYQFFKICVPVRFLKHVFGCSRYNLLCTTVVTGTQMNLRSGPKRRTSVFSVLLKKATQPSWVFPGKMTVLQKFTWWFRIVGFWRSVHRIDKTHYGNTFDHSSLHLRWTPELSLRILCCWRAACGHTPPQFRYSVPASPLYRHRWLRHVLLQKFWTENYCSPFHLNIRYIF